MEKRLYIPQTVLRIHHRGTQRHTKELNASVCLCGEMSINFVRILITLTNNKAHLLGQITAPDTPLLRIKVIGTVSNVFHKA